MFGLISYLELNNYKKIPENWYPTKFYSFSFDGGGNFSIVFDDPEWMILTSLASKTINSFFDLLKENYIFTEPQIILQFNGKFIVKVGTMEIEEYEERTLNAKIENINEKF